MPNVPVMGAGAFGSATRYDRGRLPPDEKAPGSICITQNKAEGTRKAMNQSEGKIHDLNECRDGFVKLRKCEKKQR